MATDECSRPKTKNQMDQEYMKNNPVNRTEAEPKQVSTTRDNKKLNGTETRTAKKLLKNI
jgi:hypothetical protein